MTDEEKKAILASMYDQGDDDADDTPRAQPEQLRLAGKATLIPHQGGHVALARVEYVERLEAVVREQQKVIDGQAARIRKLELRMDRMMNIAGRRIQAVESSVQTIKGNRWDY